MRADQQPSYTADNLSLAQELGNRAALALENARLVAALRQSDETLPRSSTPAQSESASSTTTAARWR